MSITRLTEGRTYYGTDIPAVLNLLVDGDEVVAWVEGGTGVRGPWSGTDESRNIGGWYIHGHDLTEVTVTSLAPRRPEWATALVVRDREGAHYLRHPEWADEWTDASGHVIDAAYIAKHDPITVIVDADGQISKQEAAT